MQVNVQLQKLKPKVLNENYFFKISFRKCSLKDIILVPKIFTHNLWLGRLSILLDGSNLEVDCTSADVILSVRFILCGHAEPFQNFILVPW